MEKLYFIVIFMLCSLGCLKAQEGQGQQQQIQQNAVTQDDIITNMDVDYAKIKLPPLSVLYENARSTPSIQILEKEKQLQKKLLAKEKKNWLGFFNASGNVSYGIADNVGSSTDVNSPLIYRYVGTEQTSWNVGGGVSIPFESLFDIRGKVRRQRIQVDIAELKKQEAYENLKIQIAHLYVQILSNIETLQRSAENIALYKGASAVAEQEYRNRRTSIEAVAQTKEKEFAANQAFASLRSTINDQLLMLEIISHTPILTIQGEQNSNEMIEQEEQQASRKKSKKKDKTE
ncbi:TolC family protein [Phocaeicola sp.]